MPVASASPWTVSDCTFLIASVPPSAVLYLSRTASAVFSSPVCAHAEASPTKTRITTLLSPMPQRRRIEGKVIGRTASILNFRRQVNQDSSKLQADDFALNLPTSVTLGGSAA